MSCMHTNINADGGSCSDCDYCLHEVIFGAHCAICGEPVENLYEDYTNNYGDVTYDSVGTFDSKKEIERIQKGEEERLPKADKLSLVVDLDQTIVDTTWESYIAEWVDNNKHKPDSLAKDMNTFTLNGNKYAMKLRPGTIEFLRSMSDLYEMYVYTMGTRPYAEAIIAVIDPTKELFQDRILTRDENGGSTKKSLDLLFPVDQSKVVILDDRADVWDHSPNLIQIKPYKYFAGASDINTPLNTQSIKPVPTETIPADVNTSDANKNDQFDLNGSNSEVIRLNSDVDNKQDAETKKMNNAINDKQDVESKETDGARNNKQDVEAKEINGTINKKPDAGAKKPNGSMKNKQSVKTKEPGNSAVNNRNTSATHQDDTGVDSNGDKSISGSSSDESDDEPEVKHDKLNSKTLAQGGRQPTTSNNLPSDDSPDEKGNTSDTKAKNNTSPGANKSINEDASKSNNLIKDKSNDAQSQAVNAQSNSQDSGISISSNIRGKPKNSILARFNPQHEDTDQILKVIEKILTDVHNEFYTRVDMGETRLHVSTVLFYIKQKVLKNCTLAFSGVIPVHYGLRDESISRMATSFGANCLEELTNKVTHLVAANADTLKPDTARKYQHVKIVSPPWLTNSIWNFKKENEELYIIPMEDVSSEIENPEEALLDLVEEKEEIKQLEEILLELEKDEAGIKQLEEVLLDLIEEEEESEDLDDILLDFEEEDDEEIYIDSSDSEVEMILAESDDSEDDTPSPPGSTPDASDTPTSALSNLSGSDGELGEDNRFGDVLDGQSDHEDVESLSSTSFNNSKKRERDSDNDDNEDEMPSSKRLK